MVLGNVTNNGTSAVQGGEIAGARHRLMLIEAYVCITAITLSFLAVFGSFRRRSHSAALRNIIRAAYELSTCFVAYTIGQMQSATFRNELFAIWAVFFVIVLGSTDSITAFSLDDNEKTFQYNLTILVQSFWMGWLIGTYDHETKFKPAIYTLWFLSLLRTGERLEAMFQASKSSGLARNTKLVSDFMAHEHEQSNVEEVDPVSMKGYNYLVFGEDDDKVKIAPPDYRKKLVITDEVITVSKVWECKGRLLNLEGDPDGKVKDIVLSFALFRLLSRRFAGYPFLESTIEKTWKFVRGGLISEKEYDDDRAFRVIEVELAFLYDYFYTKYPIIFKQKLLISRIIQFLSIIVGIFLAVHTLISYNSPGGYLNLITVHGHDVDVLVTGIAMLAILFVEIVQVITIVCSDWSKVYLVCKYVKKNKWQHSEIMENTVQFICSRGWLKPWERKLSQYSLLKSLDHKNILEKGFDCLYTSAMSSYNYFFSIAGKSRKGIKESCRIELSVEVKKAVILSLRINGRRLTNGVASLERNGVAEELSWACRLETHTHVIMVWHIATSLCEIAYSQAKQKNQGCFITAASLSNYCAYLVAFAPRLLPDQAYNTQLIFDQIIIEAKDFLKDCNSMTEMYEKLMAIGKGNQGDTIMERGAKLGNLLVQSIEDEELRWKVLSDFWAELMLFLSPSDDTDAHAEYLARGGEFVTHLWALLSHSGILERPSDVHDYV